MPFEGVHCLLNGSNLDWPAVRVSIVVAWMEDEYVLIGVVDELLIHMSDFHASGLDRDFLRLLLEETEEAVARTLPKPEVVGALTGWGHTGSLSQLGRPLL